MNHVLIVDDDPHINQMLTDALRNEGYTVSNAYSGTEALMVLQQCQPDLMLPGMTGETLLPQIREIPVIVVSAKADPADKVGLLLGGAADYVTKPFDMQELLARIKVQLRRSTNPAEKNVLRFHEITLHTDTHIAAAGGTEIRLTRTEFAILKLLMQNPEQVAAKLTILERISEDTPDCTEDSLKIHIHNLRKKLKAASGRDYITAIWGIGFMLTAKS